MTDKAKNIIKAYRTYKTCKWIAIAGVAVFGGGIPAIPMIAEAIAEQLAEEGLAELIAGSAEQLFGITFEKIGEETVYKFADEVITSEKALELLEIGYEGQVTEALVTADSLALLSSGSLFISAQEGEDQAQENIQKHNVHIANKCLILINSFLLTADERKKLNELLKTVMKISDPIQQKKKVERLLSRLRKSDDGKTNGRDLFDAGQLKLSLV